MKVILDTNIIVSALLSHQGLPAKILNLALNGNIKIVYDNNIMDIVLSRMTQNQDFCEKYLEDEEFRKEVDKILLPLVHSRLSKI